MGWAEKWNNFKQKAGEVINDGVSFVKDNAHTLLDAAGFIPGVGTVADVINAGIYVAEGDWKNAGLSALSAVPAIGDGIAAVSKSTKVVKAAKTISKIGDIANEGVGLYGDLKDALDGDLSGIGMNLLFAKISKGKIETGATSKKLKESDDFIDEIKSKNKKRCANGTCFTGDTLVYTKKGYLPIQNIRAGDDIYSREERTGETGFQKVEEVFLRSVHTIYTIEVNTTMKIQTTSRHPFYVEGEGWVIANQLQVGMNLQTLNGTAVITDLRKERTDEVIPVYNFRVSGWSSYFVSEWNVYVHNGGYKRKDNPKDYLNEALRLQGLTEAPKRFKQKFTRDGYNYEVRIHAGESMYTDADTIYRVSRKAIPDPSIKIQGTGAEYLGSDGNWYHESVLKEFFRDGSPNPNYNSNAAKATHIKLE